MSKIVNHEISGHNFHGLYRIVLRGPAEGFDLSPSQARRYEAELCGVSGCTCGGGYGVGPDAGSARIEQVDYGRLRLIPAKD